MIVIRFLLYAVTGSVIGYVMANVASMASR